MLCGGNISRSDVMFQGRLEVLSLRAHIHLSSKQWYAYISNSFVRSESDDTSDAEE